MHDRTDADKPRQDSEKIVLNGPCGRVRGAGFQVNLDARGAFDIESLIGDQGSRQTNDNEAQTAKDSEGDESGLTRCQGQNKPRLSDPLGEFASGSYAWNS